MLQHHWLDAMLVGVMVVGIVGTLVHRIHLDYGLGDRTIQLVGICLIIPTVLILGLEDKIDKQNIGTILGAIVGYVLAGIGKRDPSRPRKNGGKETESKEKENSN